MSNLVMQCPACSEPFQVAPDAAGQTVACPSCNSAVLIPRQDDPSPPATASTETIVHHCPECRGPFGLTREMQGKRIACPHCEKEVTVELESAFQPDRSPTEPEDELFAPGFAPQPGSPEAEPSDTPAPGDAGEAKKRGDKRKSNRFKGGSVQPVDEATGQPIEGLPPTSPSNLDPLIEPADRPPETATNPSGLPTMHRSGNSGDPDQEQDESTREATGLPVAGALPAPFLIDDPQSIASGHQRDTTKVMLPDEAEGARQFDRRLVKIEYKGQIVELVSRTPEEQIRYRNRVNFVSMLLGLLFILIAFLILLW
ncbi:MAG: hypothetical protein MK108_12910 [Mariniblastus sp.]|nr:hypothetical protein [Mariniblastus sp.]